MESESAALAEPAASPEALENNLDQDSAAANPAIEGEALTSVNVSPEGAENVLILSFTDTSWVDIRDANGERLAYKSYAQGEDLTVRATTSMSVFLGNAIAVSATLNDQEYDISQFREGAFARFTIGE